MPAFKVVQLEPGSPYVAAWRDMRAELWPNLDPAENAAECLEMVDRRARFPVFVALDPDGKAAGFAEARLRDYGEGCETSPVGYLEGWYVRPEWRRRGAGRALVEAAENWARLQGAVEMGSDTEIGNAGSEVAHRALGYRETGRIICFRKPLD